MSPRLPQPELSSPRLRLREVREGDAAALFAIHSDARVMRYWSYPAWTELEQAEQKIADIQRQRRELDMLVWAIADADSDLLIGSSAIFHMDLAQARAEIGYACIPTGRAAAWPAKPCSWCWATSSTIWDCAASRPTSTRATCPPAAWWRSSASSARACSANAGR